MNFHTMLRLFLAFVLTGGVSHGLPAAQERRQEPDRAVSLEQFKPTWRPGDQWVVETASLQPQRADVRQARSRGKPVRWQFTVQTVEQLGGRQCYRVEIRPLAAGRRGPVTTLWVDRQSFCLRQFQTQLPVAGGFRTVTEHYRFGEGKSAPVFGPLTALPIELPVFAGDYEKSVQPMRYETVVGPAAEKAVDDIGFAIQVRQRVARPRPEQVRPLLDQALAKDVEGRTLVEVQLAGPERQVRQFWQAGCPWPVFVDNGTTVARLLKVTAAAKDVPRPGASRAPQGDERFAKALPPSSAMAERASSTITPWSGYWWPIREGGLLGPLAKYDQLTGHKAASWERSYHAPDPNAPQWHGYCHAWAASAVMEREPMETRLIPASAGATVMLTIGAQKGLLAACHTQDVANAYGDRFSDGEGDEDPNDLSPGTLWRLLKLYMKQQRVPLILDVEAREEVWNYPIYSYEIKYWPEGASGRYRAHLSLLMADNDVPPDYCGTQVRRQTYHFTFRLDDGAIAMESARWIGRSRRDHPDFAWYPYLAVAENPEVDYETVQRLVNAQAVPSVTTEPEEEPDRQRPGPQPDRRPDTEPVAPPVVSPAPVAQPQPAIRPVPSEPEPARPEPVLVGTPTPEPGAPETRSTPYARGRPVAISPMELVALITDKTSSFGLDVTVDRFDGGHYRPGETFSVRVASERAGHLYLLHLDARGQLTLLFPLAGQDNRIEAEQSFVVPRPRDRFAFRATLPAGTNRVIGLVTQQPLVLTGLTSAAPAQQSDARRQQRPAAPCRGFRWHPTQKQQIQRLLKQYQAQKPLDRKQLEVQNPRSLLGAFARDEVAFYVERATEPAERPKAAEPAATLHEQRGDQPRGL